MPKLPEKIWITRDNTKVADRQLNSLRGISQKDSEKAGRKQVYKVYKMTS